MASLLCGHLRPRRRVREEAHLEGGSVSRIRRRRRHCVRGRSFRKRRVGEGEPAVAYVDLDAAALTQAAKEDLVGQDAFDLRLNEAGHRARTEGRVIPLFRQIAARRGGQLDEHLLLIELRIELENELVYDTFNDRHRQRSERDGGVETVAELG